MSDLRDMHRVVGLHNLVLLWVNCSTLVFVAATGEYLWALLSLVGLLACLLAMALRVRDCRRSEPPELPPVLRELDRELYELARLARLELDDEFPDGGDEELRLAEQRAAKARQRQIAAKQQRKAMGLLCSRHGEDLKVDPTGRPLWCESCRRDDWWCQWCRDVHDPSFHSWEFVEDMERARRGGVNVVDGSGYRGY